MDEVFIDYAPVSRKLALFDAPLEVVANEYCDWTTSLGHYIKPRSIAAGTQLANVFGALYPLVRGPYNRMLFIAAKDNWTVATNNPAHGPDLGFSTVLAERAWCLNLNVSSSKGVCERSKKSPPIQGYVFDIAWTPEGRKRSIYCTKDFKKWDFETFGEPKEWECLEQYKARLKRERLPHELIVQYAEKIAFNPWLERNYPAIPKDHGPRAILVQEAVLPQFENVSYAESLNALGIEAP